MVLLCIQAAKEIDSIFSLDSGWLIDLRFGAGKEKLFRQCIKSKGHACPIF
jgi:hypothetical protein